MEPEALNLIIISLATTALAIENRRLWRQIHRQDSRLDMLRDVSMVLASHTKLIDDAAISGAMALFNRKLKEQRSQSQQQQSQSQAQQDGTPS